MEISNFREFENVCARRGWSAANYVDEVEERATVAGDYGTRDIYGEYITPSGRRILERFDLVRAAVFKIENEETGKRRTVRGCDEVPPGWFVAYEIKPARYRFEKNNEITRDIKARRERRAR